MYLTRGLHSIIGLHLLLFLQPVRGQSALGWFINNNNEMLHNALTFVAKK